MRRAERVRGFTSFEYAARSWNRKRCVVTRLQATPRGFDARDIVISLKDDQRRFYGGIYCACGQTENLIKLHKSHLASD